MYVCNNSYLWISGINDNFFVRHFTNINTLLATCARVGFLIYICMIASKNNLNYPANLKEIYSTQEFKDLSNKNALFFVDFYATWCSPCNLMELPYMELAKNNAGYMFVKCNVDNSNFAPLLEKLGVLSLPTFLVFKNGEKAGEIQGAQIEKLNQLVAAAIAEQEKNGGYETGKVIELKSVAQFKHFAQSKSLVFVDFSATWCNPCRHLEPHFEDLARQYPEAKFVKCDIEKVPEVASYFNILSVPTILVLKNGAVINKLVGPTPKVVANVVQSEFEGDNDNHGDYCGCC